MMDAVPPPSLRAALDAGDWATGFTAFQALLNGSRLAPAVLAWIERGWTAFAATDENPEGLAQALGEGRRHRRGAVLLFGRTVHGLGYPDFGLPAIRSLRTAAAPQADTTFLLCAMELKGGGPQAQALLQQCLQDFPEPSTGWSDLGAVLLARGKRDAALVCFGRGVPSLALAMRRGLIAKDLGRLPEASAAFEEAVARAPTVPRAWFLLGTCAQDRRDFARAAIAYAAVLRLDPTIAEAAFNLGTVRQESGDLDGAKAAYRQAVRSRADTFGRVAQALSTSPRGELWLDLGALRRDLAG